VVDGAGQASVNLRSVKTRCYEKNTHVNYCTNTVTRSQTVVGAAQSGTFGQQFAMRSSRGNHDVSGQRRTGGRPPKLTDDDIEAAKAMLANPEIGVTQIAPRLGVSPATFHRYIPAARTANTPGVIVGLQDDRWNATMSVAQTASGSRRLLFDQ
jgi:Helix-turn-helix domain of resolvase